MMSSMWANERGATIARTLGGSGATIPFGLRRLMDPDAPFRPAVSLPLERPARRGLARRRDAAFHQRPAREHGLRRSRSSQQSVASIASRQPSAPVAANRDRRACSRPHRLANRELRARSLRGASEAPRGAASDREQRERPACSPPHGIANRELRARAHRTGADPVSAARRRRVSDVAARKAKKSKKPLEPCAPAAFCFSS
jgi:hypothetical protein